MSKIIRFELPRANSDTKYGVSVVASWIVSIHDRADSYSGCDIMLGNGNRIAVENNAIEVVMLLEDALKS